VLTSAIGGGEWGASRPGRLTPRERAPYLLDRKLGGTRADLNAVVKRNNPCPCRESNPGRPSRSSVTILTELFRLLLYFRLLSKKLKIILYKTIILSVVLCGCETWSLTLREGHGLRVCENRVLRRIFGPKREEVAVGRRRLHNEELHNLYASPNIIMIRSRKM
jgi:hypothetical protein